MDIGGALAAARRDCGLTVDQVSQRTRIRTAIIRAIERGDFAMCGGDFYARGHIKLIARAVGADPAPFLAEYDRARAPVQLPPQAAPVQDAPPQAGPVQDAPPQAGPALAAPPAPGPLMAAGESGGLPTRQPSRTAPAGPAGLTAAEAFGPVMPLPIAGNRRRHPARAGVLAAAALAIIAGVTYLLTSTAPAPAARHPAAAAGRPRPAPTAAPSPRAPSPPAGRPLPIAAAEAFGPEGASEGDNPESAAFSVDPSSQTMWHTDWYAHADLNGKAGTGLLLDMGRPVTVSSVQLQLGSGAGGRVQLREGNAPVLASLPVVSRAALPAGRLTIQAGAREPARYVLIWFTRLPPDGAGTYQAFIRNVVVSGTS